MPTQTEMIGKFIGDYQITGQLGEGGMGVVYKGVHPSLGQVVAVKMLHPNLIKAESIKQRFLREAQAMARLRHPNILQLYNFIENADGCFIIMEFVEGKTFESLLEESGVIPSERSIDLFVPTLAAMKYAHDAGIIHRDIKPSNIMLLNNGTVKVMDFGTAKMSGGPALTAAGMTLGTVVYMSPEQLMGRELSPAADIYSLGVTLYELCTGKLPFYHDNEMQLMKMIMKEAPPPPSRYYAGLPKSLEAVILKSIEKDKVKRYQTSDEFSKALEAVKAELARASSGSGAAAATGGAARITTPPPMPAPKMPTPPGKPVAVEDTQAMSMPGGPAMATPVPPAPAGARTSPLVIVGAVVAGLGVVAGLALLLAVSVVVGVATLASLVVVGVILLVVGLVAKPVDGGPPATMPGEVSTVKGGAPQGAAGQPTPMPADQQRCPSCNRVLLPTMASCPFCTPVKAGAGDTDQQRPSQPPSGTAYLDVIDGALKGQRVQSGQEPMTIGRAPDNTVCFKDPSVSSHHARIDFYQGKYFLSDLQSSNGTYVNNARIEQAQLNHQDLIALGSTRVIMNCG